VLDGLARPLLLRLREPGYERVCVLRPNFGQSRIVATLSFAYPKLDGSGGWVDAHPERRRFNMSVLGRISLLEDFRQRFLPC